MKRYLIIIASVLGLLADCTAPSASPIPTPYPPEYLPTVIAMTAEAAGVSMTETALAQLPTATPTETPTSTPEPTATFTPLPTFTPTSFPEHPLGTIRFISPGPMSKLISPIQLHMDVIAAESRKIQVDLYGEDGRLLARELRTIPFFTKGAFISLKITFETRAVAELGRISVITLDNDGRIVALNSLHVLLLSTGINEINPAGNPSEPVAVFNPAGGEAVSGGVVNVKGDIWPYSLEPVILELIDPDNKSLGLRILTVDTIDPQLFDTTIPYKVTDPVTVRLTIRQDDDRIPGSFYIYSQDVLLNP